MPGLPISRTIAIAAVSAALAFSTLLVSPPAANGVDGLGITVTPQPPKRVLVEWDDSAAGPVDYVLVGVKPVSAPEDEWFFKPIGEADNDVEPDLPSTTTVTDLNVSTSYSIRVTLMQVGGGSVAETVRAQGFRLTAKSDRTKVLRGQPITLTGNLKEPGTSGEVVSGAAVVVQENRYPLTDNQWTAVTTATTAGDGAFSTSVTPTQNAQYRAIYSEVGVGSWTSPIQVDVRVKVTVGVSPSPVRFGDAATFSGALRAPDAMVAGAPVLLQRRVKGIWGTVAQGTVSASGRYSIPFKSQNNVDSYYRVRTNAGPSFADSTSRSVQLVVR